MSTKPHSATLICQSDDRDWVDRLSCALGYAPYDSEAGEPLGRTMVIELSKTGKPPVARYAAHSRADDEFATLFATVSDGYVPDSPRNGVAWSDFVLTKDDVQNLIPRLVVNIVRNAAGNASWQPALDTVGLKRMTSFDPTVETTDG